MVMTSTERSRKLRNRLTDEQRVAKRTADAERKRLARAAMSPEERRASRGARGTRGDREGQRARAFERETGVPRGSILARNDGLCVWCGAAPATTVDHVVARVNGGALTADNLAGACLSCNSAKRDRDWGKPSWR